VYYKIDLNNYKPKEVLEYHTYNDFVFSVDVLGRLEEELDNFKDSFGKPWKEWDIPELKHRLENNYTFYLISTDEEIKGWAFTDWNKKYPYLCNRYVVPEYRKRGLGSELVWLRCNEVVKLGYKSASIKLENWNTPALSVKKENIFIEIKEI